MTEDKKTLASKLKDHYTENKEGYTKFGYYCLGVAAMTVTYTVLDYYTGKARTAKWDAAELEALEKFGDKAVVVRSREGRFGVFVPNSPEN
jgi:hypothetical protein